MNKERIKELHYRAGVWANNQMPFTNPEWVNLRDSKFAELIVEECRNVVSVVYRNTPLELCGPLLTVDEGIANRFYGVTEND